MNPSDAMMQLKALGYTLDSGYVFNGKYRYGRIFEDAFLFSEAKRYDVKGRNYL